MTEIHIIAAMDPRGVPDEHGPPVHDVGAAMICSDCGRLFLAGHDHHADTIDVVICGAARDAYRRGIARGVELARDNAIPVALRIDEADIDWSDVDRAAREETDG